MGSRILLADDSITIQKVVNLTFADEGIEVVAVSNGDLAERRLNDVKPDLVLADIFMPGKNGYELCEAIKQSPQFCNVPVVLLVGAFEPFDQGEASRVRADAHLTKPFESRTLVETVRRLIAAGPRAAAGPTAPAMPENDHKEEVRATGPIVAPPLATPPARLDLSAMSIDAAPAGSTLRVTTGEIASQAPYVMQGLSGDGAAEATSHETATAILTEAAERFEETALQVSGPTMDFDSNAPLLDFETPESFGSPMPVLSFEHDESGSVENLLSDMGGDTEWFGRGAQATRQPDADEALWQPAATTPLSYPDAPSFESRREVEFGAAESENAAASATVLGVDEPLGDVLQHDGVSTESQPFVDMLAGDSLGFEITEAVDQPVLSAQFEVLDVIDQHPQDSVSTDQQAAALGFKAADPTGLPVESQSIQGNHPANDLPGQSSDAVNRDEDLDWTAPSARVYSTAQLDSVVMPIQGAEHPKEFAASEEQQVESNVEASFAPPPLMEEEAHFTPIDVEAADMQASPNGGAKVETGFSFSSIGDREPASALELQPSVAATPAANTSSAGELSTAAIEEIVRRVVAQMSESVVREVAWEVVPDCVERVIDQLTRESLSKRM